MVSAFSGAMGSVLSKLAGLLAQDFKLARGVKEDIVSLRDEMSTINALLTHLSQMEEPIDALDRELRGRVRELAYDMEDCLDISVHRLGDGDASKAGSLPDLIKKLSGVRARCDISKLISSLKARVAELCHRGELITQLPEHRRAVHVRVDPRIQALYQDAGSLQGIGGHKEKIVELLQDGAPQLKVVSILGTGGIGKTTLANQVYTAIRDTFDCTAFVSVSRIPRLAKILSGIMEQILWFSLHKDEDDVKELIDDLRQGLQNRRHRQLRQHR